MSIKISKCMSWYLRHGAGSGGTEPLDNGWSTVDNLAKVCQCPAATILEVAANNSKNRFEVSGNKIRARQGHSIEVATETLYTPLELSEATATRAGGRWWVVHGTSFSRLGALRAIGYWQDKHRTVCIELGDEQDRVGLKCMTRTHIHMSPNTRDRWHSWYDIEVWVDVEAAQAAGIKFELSSNGVVLSRGNEYGVIPARFLRPIPKKYLSE